MLLSAALIVRDESAVLAECLASIEPVVDEIVVVDTGSRDDSPAIAARFGARVLRHAWNDDFAEARNVGLDAVQGDWILYIDADERLSGTDRAGVEELLDEADEVAFRVLLQPDLISTAYREHRLWRNDPRIRFRGRIHEKVTPAIAMVSARDGRPVGDSDLLLTHVGYEGDQARKHERNLPLLRAQLSVEPNNLFNRHHLARVLEGLGRQEEAGQVLGDAVELARRRPRDELGVLAFTDYVRFRRDRGEDVTGLLAEARKRYPENKLLWWIDATASMQAGRHAKALELLDRLLAVDLAALPAEGPSYDRRIFGEFAHEARGTCLFRLGRYEEAAAAYAEAARANPSSIAYRSKEKVARGRMT
ncbi:MAG TPA: glycosyltransferase family 2 protein [Gaiellaceae bacterium]|nr:glycosyltransferase family 2 protein [Gaiellaceae bacterium]